MSGAAEFCEQKYWYIVMLNIKSAPQFMIDGLCHQLVKAKTQRRELQKILLSAGY
jgi:hypothetical protein